MEVSPRDWTHRGWLDVSRTYRAKRGEFGKLPATRAADVRLGGGFEIDVFGGGHYQAI